MNLLLKFFALFCILASSLAVADGNPVHLRFRPAGAREAPPTVEDMLFMIARPAPREWNADVPCIGTVTNGQDGISWYEGGWKRPIYIGEYTCYLHIPSGNDYTFHVRQPLLGPVYLLINGEPVVDCPNLGSTRQRRRDNDEHPPEEWISGKPIHLEKGNVELHMIFFCDTRVMQGLRWSVPGDKEPKDVPASLFSHAETLRYGKSKRPLVYKSADARLDGVPPFCYGEDAIRPAVNIRSDVKTVTVEAQVRSEGKVSFAVTSVVETVQGWGRVELPETTAGACDEIQWRVSDGRQILADNVARFLKYPFSLAPTAARGSALMHGQTNCIYVAKRYGEPRQPESLEIRSGAKAVFFDGFGATSPNLLSRALNRVFSGEAPEISSVVRPDELVDADSVMLADPALAKVANLSRIPVAGADVLVFAPEIKGAAYGESLAVFERRLAVIAGLFAGKADRPFVLVTPPADLLPSGENMRDYAVVIHRIADAYGIRVADLYSAGLQGR